MSEISLHSYLYQNSPAINKPEGAAGEPGHNFRYWANISSDASPEANRELINYVNDIAEIQQILRNGIEVSLVME